MPPAVRRALAQKTGVPPYMVFSDRTLKTLVRNRPDTTAALLRVHGVGDRKAERYGKAFLTAIREFLSSGECPG